MELPETIKERVRGVAHYLGDMESDWFLVKDHLRRSFTSPMRILFSKNHPRTRKPTGVNVFERNLMDFWFELTGVKLFVDPTKLHPKESYDPNKTRGWNLKKNKT